MPAIVVGGAVVWWGPALASRCRWRTVPLLAGASASLWALALAASDGWSAVTEPLASRHEYEPFAAGIDDLGPFLGTYVERLAERPIHVQGHPPGPVVLAWLLDRVGLGGAGWLALLVLAGWGIAVAAVLITARIVAGEEAARRAAPALTLLPAAVWAGTSLDALFAALVATAIALLLIAATRHPSPPPTTGEPAAVTASRVSVPLATGAGDASGATASPGSAPWGAAVGVVAGVGRWWRHGVGPASLEAGAGEVAGVTASPGSVPWGAVGSSWRHGVGAVSRGSVPLGAGAGVVAGVALLSSYGAAASLLVGVFVAGVLGCPRRVWAAAAAGVVGTLLAAAAVGFWWPAGLAATGDRYWDGIAAERPAAYLTLLGNPAALALATGPAVAVGLWKLRGRAALLPYAALVAVAAADLSQMSRGEIERIWLPFVPFLALAAPGSRRGWLAAQAGVALAVQSTLISAW